MALTPVEHKRWQGMYDSLAKQVRDLDSRLTQLLAVLEELQDELADHKLRGGEQ